MALEYYSWGINANYSIYLFLTFFQLDIQLPHGSGLVLCMKRGRKSFRASSANVIEWEEKSFPQVQGKMIMTKKHGRAIEISFIKTHNTTYIHITYTSYYFIKSRPSLFIFSSVPTVFTFHVYLGCAITVLDLHCIFYSCAKRTSFSISIFSQHVVFLIRLQEPHKTYTIGYVRDNTSLGSNLRWYNPHPLQLHPLGMH